MNNSKVVLEQKKILAEIERLVKKKNRQKA